MRTLLLVCLVSLLLTACAVRPPVPVDDREQAWRERVQLLSAQDEWTLSGRIALFLENEQWNAHLRWRQRGDDYDIQLFGPFGRHAATLEGNATGVTLRNAEGDVYQDRDVDRLVHQALGWQLPVSGLRYWVLGIPSHDRLEGRTLDSAGRAQRLLQSGWDVGYDRYAEAVGPAPLPDRMRLEFDDIRVRLVVDDWQMTP
ncbi:lipoprotein insertase outer membrane protein LolB [Ectothiorhodospira shaposhnikovii]|uniref:lipoprotein insertase outer membrane protein LolB n=1 Tax=Ectothiorhodospira shaposhnikovii TaxID=1054 RepID=UPI001EE997EB|nr:lipoprotein insertase outer membrane protein LolB [Ectothiorhodospira shaposhnikovii]MCG5511648.1 lipoprotein insertase outer membrane protein LolB [Ectothiorhodospira shaposhnikovii]